MKKIGLNITFLLTILLVFCGIIFSSCCSPKPCKVSVVFEGADERLNLNNYSYNVEFNDDTSISFDVPAGYDHTKIKAKIDSVDIDYEVEYAQGEVVAENYEYACKKTITYKVENVKRNFKLTIDLSQMQKYKFKITTQKGMSGFKLLVVPESKLDRFITLEKADVLEEIPVINNVAEIEYGKIVLMCQTLTADITGYSQLYSTIGHFTEDRNKANIGTLNYSVYNLAKKGNANYWYGSNSATRLYYIGQIKEDINFYPSIPNYIADTGFKFERKPNIFYLFNNLSEYNSPFMNVETYVATNSQFNQSDSSLDRIEGQVVKKIESNYKFNDRYDVYKLYIGTDLENEILLDETEKEEVFEDFYFVITTNTKIDLFNFWLLKDESEYYGHSYKVNLSESKTTKGKYYIKLTKEILTDLSLKRDLIDDNIVYQYMSGSAIFYPEFKYNADDSGYKDYVCFCIGKEFSATDPNVTYKDIYLNLYIKDGDQKIYGFMDHQSENNQPKPRDRIYFRYEDIFDENDTYRNNLYVDISGHQYQDFKSPLIKTIGYKVGDSYITNIFKPLEVANAKEFNGYSNYKVNTLPEDSFLNTYVFTAVIDLNRRWEGPAPLDFSNLNLPDSYTDGVYITDNSEFKDIKPFVLIYSGNKNTYKSLKFGLNNDLYYFVNSQTDPDFDIEIRLDPNDPSTVVSIAKEYTDIMGNPLSIEVDGAPYYVKVLRMDSIYEIMSNVLYVVKK